MRYIKLICFLLTAAVVIPSLAKKPKDKRNYGVYMAGMSASFTDSLVYFTDIQYLDSASLSNKIMLDGRSQYSLQLKNYLEQKEGGKNRTCFIYFNKKKKKLQKELTKLKQKYQKGENLVLKQVDPDFAFEKAETYE